MKAEALKTCPEAQCQMTPWGHGAVKRLLGTGAGLLFKGSGFYITDYRSDGYKKAAKSESGSTKESKPAEKSVPSSTPAASPSSSSSSSSSTSSSTPAKS